MVKEIKRGKYNEIDLDLLNSRLKRQVLNLVYAASNADKIDEHGAGWEFGAEFDKKRERSGVKLGFIRYIERFL